jgi:FKBP-type peptidyl-prolyl cis-trans isomerase
MSERVDFAKPESDGRLRTMHAPRFVSWSLFVLLGLTASGLGLPACGRTGAVPPKPAPSAPATAPGAEPAPTMSGAGWMTPPPVDVSAPPADAEREPNGVARKILARGKGTTPPPAASYVDLRYAGWERNGKQFEGTSPSGPPGRYDLHDLAPGIAAEVAQMVEGDKRRIWVPAALAYGQRPNYVNAPKGDMTFEVELAGIAPMPAVPADLKAPPKDAKTTKSGLTYVVLKKGTGKHHPTEDSRAETIYTAWTPDGHMFQCSLAAREPVHVRVKKLPPGWREAMQLMVEGDKWRLWLPGKLAFGELTPGQEVLPFGPPPGPVVFDVELVKLGE